MLKVQVIIGSTRQQRFSEKPANWIYQQLKTQPQVQAELLDLRDYPLPFYNEALSPARLEGKYADPKIQTWVNKIDEADGYVMVAPEYNHGYPAVLKNAIDYPYYEWNKKPVGFISYGSVGGARAIEQLRQVVIELQMVPIKTSISIPGGLYIGNEDKPDVFAPLAEKADAFIDELIWLAEALKNKRSIKQQV
jgi:NAD(P)H-dependent FMN reductase